MTYGFSRPPGMINSQSRLRFLCLCPADGVRLDRSNSVRWASGICRPRASTWWPIRQRQLQRRADRGRHPGGLGRRGSPDCAEPPVEQLPLTSAPLAVIYLGTTLGSPPGVPGGGITGILRPVAGGVVIKAGSTPAGGQTTPLDSASCSLKGRLPLVSFGGSGELVTSGGQLFGPGVESSGGIVCGCA